ncbi:hypothetical protein L1987_14874 [Smallanthus sonchifolius]|uniref:Uncharacterized protein n=1 Tax=Smallanthus sonchifolius TaxID=185202 RepID=A0ACB9J3X3_9ASTR|nr:hypothetical protein L1987_14874 [Smallanthus sonchifolius]
MRAGRDTKSFDTRLSVLSLSIIKTDILHPKFYHSCLLTTAFYTILIMTTAIHPLFHSLQKPISQWAHTAHNLFDKSPQPTSNLNHLILMHKSC